MATFPTMLRTTPARRRTLLVAPLLAATLVLAACGGGSSDSSSEDDGAKATTTEASSTTSSGSKDDDAPERPKIIEDFGKVLAGSGFDDEQIDCILGVAQKNLLKSDPEGLNAAYQDECGLTATQVSAGAYYAAMVDQGIPEADAACVRDLYGNLTLEQAAVFDENADARDSLLRGCNIDPADAPSG